MSREEIQKLLGGYATDTLSEAERRTLFEAALEDQQLFDELAKEQVLRDVLQEPLARRELLESLEPAHAAPRLRVWRWLRQPVSLVLAGGAAVLLIVGVVALRRVGTPAHREYDVASVRTPPPPQKTEPLSVPVKPPARLAKPLPRLSAKSVEPAPQLYAQRGPEQMNFVAGALPQSRAKLAPMSSALPAASNLRVRYSLLLKNANGEYVPARFDTAFHPGDSVRLRLVPNDSGYLYLLQRDSDRGWRLDSTQQVLRGQPIQLPATGAFESDQPGRKELLVLLSPRAESSLGSLETAGLESLAVGASASSLNAIVSSGESAYAVDTRVQGGQQRVVFEVILEFR